MVYCLLVSLPGMALADAVQRLSRQSMLERLLQ
jgi:hypothetical protein